MLIVVLCPLCPVSFLLVKLVSHVLRLFFGCSSAVLRLFSPVAFSGLVVSHGHGVQTAPLLLSSLLACPCFLLLWRSGSGFAAAFAGLSARGSPCQGPAMICLLLLLSSCVLLVGVAWCGCVGAALTGNVFHSSFSFFLSEGVEAEAPGRHRPPLFGAVRGFGGRRWCEVVWWMPPHTPLYPCYAPICPSPFTPRPP